MKILVLGGTADARKVVTQAYAQNLFKSGGHELVYSIAGLVRTPSVPCEVISGGFTQFDGLATYIKANSIQAILDITHPFAAQMSTTAVNVAKLQDIPCWRFHREAWLKKVGDDWHYFQDWNSVVQAARPYKSLLLTVGQVNHAEITQLSSTEKAAAKTKVVLRTAAPPRIDLPQDVTWVKAIGPFTLENEKALMLTYQTDLLISKNSGGVSTQAKLDAARALAIPVFMIERPVLPSATAEFSTIESCLKGLEHWLRERTLNGTNSQKVNQDAF
jgi:precorrin-6A/cobalt-precorrin-6A reductase